MSLIDRLPPVRGKLVADEALAPFTWFRVGGPADILFLPADEDDLAAFLAATPEDIPVTVLGAASNTIVRDSGVAGVVVRLAGRYWGEISKINATFLFARAGALDVTVAKRAAAEGISGLEFLSGIPGSMGGAVPTNAGCYDRELKDVLDMLEGLNRRGQKVMMQGVGAQHGLPQLHMAYRHTDLPDDVIVTGLLVCGQGLEQPQAITARMEALKARRETTQPIREKTGGSTFANPDPPGTPNQRRAWKLIDEAGMRGARRGGAQVNELHCNFLINTGEATAADIEGLGEDVRAAVKATSGVELRWEIRRIGRQAVDGKAWDGATDGFAARDA
jgi:UDP-N-acetylmuramate dehydrogenase